MSRLPEMTIRKRVRDGRNALGLTREDFAREVGASTSTIARLELYGALPKVETLSAIARLLGVSLDDLVAESVA